MTIKFSDETIDGAQKEHAEVMPLARTAMRAAAAVFEAAANAQVAVDGALDELHGLQHLQTILGDPRKRVDVPAQGPSVKSEGCCGVQGVLHDKNGAKGPSPKFEVGKRYRTRNGTIAGPMKDVVGHDRHVVKGPLSDDRREVDYGWGADGSFLAGTTSCYDLLPKAIPDPAPEAETAMTDYDLGGVLAQAYRLGGGDSVHGYTALAHRARELLSNDTVIANLDAMILSLQAERDAWRDRALAAERHDDVVTCGFKVRAERAEGAIERVREAIEDTLRMDEYAADDGSTASRCEAKRLAETLGLTITPARELSVTWEGGE